MNCRLLILTLGFLLALPVVAATDFEYGPRPSQAVFDPDEVLDPARAGELSDPLALHLRDDGVDVIVVILKDIGNAPPEHVARQFANAWCDAGLHCVVLHVPGRADSPWILPGGELMASVPPDQIDGAVTDRQRRARAESGDFRRVKAAAAESADLLRFWKNEATARHQALQEAIRRFSQPTEPQPWNPWLARLALLMAAILGILGVVYLTGRKSTPRGPFHFPDHAWQQRLGAPHAGGNRAVRELGEPINRS